MFDIHTNKQCKHSNGGVDVILSKFNTLKTIIKSIINCAKLEYKGMKTVELQITQTRHPLRISNGKYI